MVSSLIMWFVYISPMHIHAYTTDDASVTTHNYLVTTHI